MLSIGTEAPDFTLTLHNGEQFRLSAYRGSKNVVLFFYPKDFTSGCTRQACMFSRHQGEMEKEDAMIVGISGDNEIRHREFIAAHSLSFPLGADPDLRVTRLYECLQFGFRRLRITYVIDKKGIIRGAAHHEVLIDRHWDFVRSTLQHIQTTP